MKIYLFIFDGFADWEAAFVLPELRKNSFQTATVSHTRKPIRSMGGLRVAPDTTLNKLNPGEVQLFILPGGTSWETNASEDKLVDFIQQLRTHNVPVAGICGATVFFAQMRLLDAVHHTSNALQYLQQIVPSYNGADFYIDQLAASDQGIITASGIGSLEFAFEILKLLNVYRSEEKAKEWYDFFKHGVIPPHFREA
jgi:putative intracellular protease/amidase